MLYDNPMPKEQYTEYIHSAEWKAKRRKRLEMDNHICQRCHCPDGNVVHHRTYKNIGHEGMEDLVTLCSWCHKRVHGLDKIISKKAYRAADKYERQVGWAYKKGGDLSIAEIWNITREPPENELTYQCTESLCDSVNAEMAGAGRILDSLIRYAGEEFEVRYSWILPSKPGKTSKRYEKYEKEVEETDRALEFLESKKLIVRLGDKIMIHPYMNDLTRNEVVELCYYNKFCDLWESLHGVSET